MSIDDLREVQAAQELYRCPRCRQLPAVVHSDDASIIRLRRSCSCALRRVVLEVGTPSDDPLMRALLSPGLRPPEPDDESGGDDDEQ